VNGELGHVDKRAIGRFPAGHRCDSNLISGAEIGFEPRAAGGRGVINQTAAHLQQSSFERGMIKI
jgi:hypothetical protein